LAGELPLAPRELDLVPLLRQVLEELDDANPEWSLRLSHHGNTVGTWDADRLSQVFSNLVANAIQHGEAKAGVEVTVDGTGDGHVRIEVRNAGTIPPELIPNLFEPMVGAARRQQRSRGLGLGLYITRKVVQAHGGDVWVSSSEEQGTTFTATLPREPHLLQVGATH
jgi:two-component system, sensor histidine kinase and response regulator